MVSKAFVTHVVGDGVRLEMRGLLYTGPRTILHNPYARQLNAQVFKLKILLFHHCNCEPVFNEGEREFGATVIDMGEAKQLLLLSVIKNFSLQIFFKKVEITSLKTSLKVLKTSKN